MSGGYHEIGPNELAVMKDADPSEYIHPTCNECQALLDVGDQIDGYHPYYQDHNFCKLCLPNMDYSEEEYEEEDWLTVEFNTLMDQLFIRNPETISKWFERYRLYVRTYLHKKYDLEEDFNWDAWDAGEIEIQEE